MPVTATTPLRREAAFLADFRRRIGTTANETEVRAAFHIACETTLGIRDFRFERGRQDLRRGCVILEFKDRGLFRRSATTAKFQEAYRQLSRTYIPRQAKLDRRSLTDYLGIAFDGESFALVVFDSDDPASHRHTALDALDERSASLLIQAVERSHRISLTGENLLDDFGPGAPLCNEVLAALWRGLDRGLAGRVARVEMFFTEWEDLFAQASSLGRLSQTDLQEHFERCGLPGDADPTRALFLLHTYNSILFKLLAAEVLCSVRFREDSGLCAALAAAGDDELFEGITRDIEDGRIFRDRNIRNFVEGTFFSWYTSVREPDLVGALRGLTCRLALYVMPTAATHAHDVIQDLYQGLVPRVLRHSIGEFYTPRWLAEHTLSEAAYDGPAVLDGRFLDPTCGSGTFLLLAIAAYRRAATAEGWPRKRILEGLLTHVVGFDLNPLAVIASRLNFLLAVRDLLDEDSDLELPVYLADAIYAPWSETRRSVATRSYEIATQRGRLVLELPETLVQDRAAFDRALDLIDRDVEAGASTETFRAHYRGRSRDAVAAFYEQIRRLEAQDWNRIWSRVVRNYFASIAIGQARWIVGNPPWIRWSELPASYRERVKPTCERYAIFSRTPYFGGNELDISAIVLYSVAEKWLAPGGTLAFLIPQTHFQVPSSEGFRSFELPDGTPLGVDQVHDWSAARAFDGLANKPATIRLAKGARTTYPVPYRVWERRPRARLDASMSWIDAEPQLRHEDRAASPLEPDARWAITDPAAREVLDRIAGEDPHHRGRKGITCDLNAAYFVTLEGGARRGLARVRNDTSHSRTAFTARTFEVEADLVYPLIKGAADFGAFRVELPDLYALVPNTTITGIDERAFAASYPRAYRYLAGSKRLLANRSTFRTRMRATGAPFYAIYNVGPYTFAPHKVVWAEMASGICAAVVGSRDVPGVGPRVVVPDHKVYFVPFDDAAAAHYLCAMLNSASVRRAVDAFTVKLQVGTLFRHVRIPRFDAADRRHVELSRISAEGHAGGTVDAARLDALARRVLGLRARTSG